MVWHRRVSSHLLGHKNLRTAFEVNSFKIFFSQSLNLYTHKAEYHSYHIKFEWLIKHYPMLYKCYFCKTQDKSASLSNTYSLSKHAKPEGDDQKSHLYKLSVEAPLTWSYKNCNFSKMASALLSEHGSSEIQLCMCINWLNMKGKCFERINFKCLAAILMARP